MPIKIDAADKVFSQAIRTRDRQCMRCYSPVQFNDKDLPISHQASHYFGRARENTRFDEMNVDCLCHGCHQHWGSADKEGYRQFKIEQIGQKGFDDLTIRANLYAKKDRKMALISAKLLLETYQEA